MTEDLKFYLFYNKIRKMERKNTREIIDKNKTIRDL